MSTRWIARLAVVVSVCVVVATPMASATARRRYVGTVTVLESPEHGPQLCGSVMDSYPPQCSGLPVVGWSWRAVDDEQSAGGTTWGRWKVTGTYDREHFTLTKRPGPARPPQTASGESDFSPACAQPAVVDASQGEAEFGAAVAGVFAPLLVPGLVTAWISTPANGGADVFVGSVIVQPGQRDVAVARIRERYGGALCVVERDFPTEAQLADVAAEVRSAGRSALGQFQGSSVSGRRGLVEVWVWVADKRARAYAHRRWGQIVELRGILRPTR
jgi:hypothetical protein